MIVTFLDNYLLKFRNREKCYFYNIVIKEKILNVIYYERGKVKKFI